MGTIALAICLLLPGGMFRNITLLEAFELVADEDEWREFCELKPEGDVGTWLWVFSMSDDSLPPCPREKAILRYRDLWTRFSEASRQKLMGGEWVANGFNPQFGPRPVHIDARLWKILEFDLQGGVEGSGFSFVNLSISSVRPDKQTRDQIATSNLRRELVRWIECQAHAATDPMTSNEVLAAARRAFADTKISNNMFGEAWRLASKPEHFVQKGRPKAKVVGK